MQHHIQQSRNLLRQYVLEAKRHRPLDARTEKSLLHMAQRGSHGAIQQLVRCNLLFVVKIAYKYRNQGLELEDLISAGNMGLIEGAKRMDPARDNKFITYAVWWIRQSIRHAIFNEARLIRLASNKEEKLRVLYKQGIPLKSYIGGMGMDWAVLDEKLGGISAELRPVLSLAETPVPLEAPLGPDDSGTLQDSLASPDPDPGEIAHCQERIRHLGEVSKHLERREYEVLRDYYGLENRRRLSLTQIAESRELSKERVRQIKDEALTKLRGALSRQYAYPIAA